MKPRLILLLGLLCTGMAHAGSADHIRASQAWIRVLPGDLPAAGYVQLANDGQADVRLVGASSPVYDHAMLHRSLPDGGGMAMVEAMTIPAHGTAALSPGGYHLMLMAASHAVKPGDSVPLELHFADGSRLSVDFSAKPANTLTPAPVKPAQ